MKIKIRSGNIRFSMPVPLGMVDVAIRAMPDALFEKMRKEAGPAYETIATKENISMLFRECRDIFKENKGLEIIHVEARDGTFVSIKL